MGEQMFINHNYFSSSLPTRISHLICLLIWLAGARSLHSCSSDCWVLVVGLEVLWWGAPQGAPQLGAEVHQGPSLTVTCSEGASEMCQVETNSLLQAQQAESGEIGVEGSGRRLPCGMNGQVEGRRGWLVRDTWGRWARSTQVSVETVSPGQFWLSTFLLIAIWSVFRQEFAVSQCWTVWLSQVSKATQLTACECVQSGKREGVVFLGGLHLAF